MGTDGPVWELSLNARARKCLNAEGINTIGELIQRTELDLAKLPNLGSKTLRVG